MKKIAMLSAAAALSLTCGLASAASAPAAHNGVYVGARVGVGFMPTIKDDVTIGGLTFRVKQSQNQPGMQGTVFVGYRYQDFRGELAIGSHYYTPKKIDQTINGANQGTSSAQGHTYLLPIMVNGYFDFNQLHSPIVPYVGLGLGYVYINNRAETSVPGATMGIKDHGSAMGFQAIAGVKYNIDQNWFMTLDYRYFTTTKAKFDGKYFPTAGAATVTESTEKFRFQDHTINFGVNYLFG